MAHTAHADSLVTNDRLRGFARQRPGAKGSGWVAGDNGEGVPVLDAVERMPFFVALVQFDHLQIVEEFVHLFPGEVGQGVPVGPGRASCGRGSGPRGPPPPPEASQHHGEVILSMRPRHQPLVQRLGRRPADVHRGRCRCGCLGAEGLTVVPLWGCLAPMSLMWGSALASTDQVPNRV